MTGLLKMAPPANCAAPLRPGGPSSKYRRDVDGLRAIAALFVIANHVDLLQGGFVGVDIFFVISGYLISGIIFRGLAAQRFSFLDFYVRRARRIFPALLLVLWFSLAAGFWLLPPGQLQLLGADVAAGAAFVLNFTHWWPEPQAALPKILAHLWSLGVEEQFYLLWPLVLALTWRWNRRHTGLVVLAIGAASFICDFMLAHLRPWPSFADPWNRVWQLSVGCGLAWRELLDEEPWAAQTETLRKVALSGLSLSGPNLTALLGVGLLACAGLQLSPASVEQWPALWKVAPTLGAALLIGAGEDAWINRNVLGSSGLVALGLISYPVYLWHWPILQFVTFRLPDAGWPVISAAILVSVVLAWLTYKFVEIPLRFSKNALQYAAVLLVLLVASGSVGWLCWRA